MNFYQATGYENVGLFQNPPIPLFQRGGPNKVTPQATGSYKLKRKVKGEDNERSNGNNTYK